MNNVINKEINPWQRPWDVEKFDDLYNRDERFFGVLIKGAVSWLNKNIVLYGKPINHFIFNTGSSIMFVESNGYEFKWSETTGEDYMYMHLPRCVIELGGLDIPQEELSNPFARGNYERRDENIVRGFNAEIRRLPIELSMNLHYTLANFNESIVLLQELIDKIVFQKYFNITYLGQIIECSIEFPGNTQIELNKIDMASADDKSRHIDLDIKVCSNYPIINERSEIALDKVISSFDLNMKLIEKMDTEHETLSNTENYTVS